MVCPNCDARLFTGNQAGPSRFPEVDRPEYKEQSRKLHAQLSENPAIHAGKQEIIAGETCQFVPDAIYYDATDTAMQKPMIYQIVPYGDSAICDETIRKCRLFSTTAKNLFGTFSVAISVPGVVNANEEHVREILSKHKIGVADIIVL
jgi:hypothetical protein